MGIILPQKVKGYLLYDQVLLLSEVAAESSPRAGSGGGSTWTSRRRAENRAPSMVYRVWSLPAEGFGPKQHRLNMKLLREFTSIRQP